MSLPDLPRPQATSLHLCIPRSIIGLPVVQQKKLNQKIASTLEANQKPVNQTEAELRTSEFMIPIPTEVKNILIIRLGAIGDVVQTLPTVEQLKRNFPEAKIHWAIEGKSYPIVEHHPGVEFHIFPREKLRLNKPSAGPTGSDPSIKTTS